MYNNGNAFSTSTQEEHSRKFNLNNRNTTKTQSNMQSVNTTV